MDYRIYATACVDALMKWYNPTTGLWDTTGWWNSANALEALVDYAALQKTTKYHDIIAHTFAVNRNRVAKNSLQGNFCGQYYDDQLWWGLAWLKAYELTQVQEYLDTSVFIFTDATYAWDTTCGGGLWWNRTHTYKNAITNELFLALAHRLSAYKTTLLPWLVKAWSWFLKSGMLDLSTYLVCDGLDFKTCQPTASPTWTYNQGVILCMPNTLRVNIATAAIDTLTQNGILVEPCESTNACGGDGPQFKGIFLRYLAQLWTETGIQVYKEFIIKQADSIWANNRTQENRFGLHWAGPVDTTDAARQTAVLDAFNAAVRVTGHSSQSG